MSAKNKMWSHISSTILGDQVKAGFERFPEARQGLFMASYYDYIILFSGQNMQRELLNDLWVFSIIESIFSFLICL